MFGTTRKPDLQIVSDGIEASIEAMGVIKPDKYNVPEIRDELQKMGYDEVNFSAFTNYWRVLNVLDCGIPRVLTSMNGMVVP